MVVDFPPLNLLFYLNRIHLEYKSGDSSTHEISLSGLLNLTGLSYQVTRKGCEEFAQNTFNFINKSTLPKWESDSQFLLYYVDKGKTVTYVGTTTSDFPTFNVPI